MANIDIAGRLHSTATGNTVAGANEILDDALGKKQSQVNADVGETLVSHESRLNAFTEGNFVTVESFSALPATGSVDTVYRVSSWDGTANSGQGAADVTKYSEYAWENGAYKFLDVKTQIGEVFDISVYNNNAKYADLAAALNGGANIPQSLQKGGMSVKFVLSSDNKYVQYRYMGTSTANADFAKVNNWQGIEEKPAKKSKNLVISSGLSDIFEEYSSIYSLYFELGNIGISGSGWIYTYDTSRVRIKQGYEVFMHKGDIVGLSDYTNARFFIGYRTKDGIYKTPNQWQQADQVLPEDGYYVFLLANVTETTQSSYHDLADIFFVRPAQTNSAIAKELEDFKETGLFRKNVIEIAEKIVGGYIRYDTGVFVDTSSYNPNFCVYKLSVEEKQYKKVRVKTRNGDTVPASIAFYNAKTITPKSYISGVQIKTTTTWQEAVVPDNCVLICITNNNSLVTPEFYAEMSAYDTYSHLSDVTSLTEDGTKPSISRRINCYYTDYNTGELVLSGSYFDSYLIPNRGYSLISAYLGSGNNVPVAIAFYTTRYPSQTGYLKSVSIQHENTNGKLFSAVVPNNCSLIVVTNRNSLVDSPSINLLGYSPVSNKKEVDVLGNEIDNITGKVSKDWLDFPYFYHYSPAEFTAGIPSQSLEDNLLAKRLGFKFVEANFITTATAGKYFVMHEGQNETFGTEVQQEYQSARFSEMTYADILENVRYGSSYECYNHQLSTPESFFQNCAQLGLGVYLRLHTADIVELARKYLPDDRIMINVGDTLLTRDILLREKFGFKGILTRVLGIGEPADVCNINYLRNIAYAEGGAPYHIIFYSKYITYMIEQGTLENIVSTLKSEGIFIGACYTSTAMLEILTSVGGCGLAASLGQCNLLYEANIGSWSPLDSDLSGWTIPSGIAVSGGKIINDTANPLVVITPSTNVISLARASIQARIKGTVSFTAGECSDVLYENYDENTPVNFSVVGINKDMQLTISIGANSSVEFLNYLVGKC